MKGQLKMVHVSGFVYALVSLDLPHSSRTSRKDLLRQRNLCGPSSLTGLGAVVNFISLFISTAFQDDISNIVSTALALLYPGNL
ncbi:hypothetical protein D9757_000351 [Collybiopsis confluens]|uniref:Uncharacterized protein n=1 Tax=Collybiopsis confluens TaxID=2823264 RepID=A0A8H5I2F2_9AGAR|nr:hypothetical protein D9757_000351 [Collybiopsis confluens]